MPGGLGSAPTSILGVVGEGSLGRPGAPGPVDLGTAGGADHTAAPRPAATLMLVRDPPGGAPGGLEVLMVRRSLRSSFVGGAYVFPGGAVEDADRGGDAEARCLGRDDRTASGVLGVPVGGLAYWVAALRECFEEAGILLACRDGGRLLELREPSAVRRFSEHRAAINRGERSLLEVCAAEGLHLAVDRVHYFAHWITPELAPRRYDTRFFVAMAPAEQTALHDEGEMIADLWTRPGDALSRHRAGEIELIFPTIRNLQAIARFETAEELVRAAAHASGVPSVLPRVVTDGNGVRVLLPGDPGYDQPGGQPVRATGDFSRAVRAISKAANTAEPAPGGVAITGEHAGDAADED